MKDALGHGSNAHNTGIETLPRKPKPISDLPRAALLKAYEKAQAANKGKDPSIEQLMGALEYLKFDSPAGTVDMSLGKGHQAVMSVPYGTVRKVDGKVTLTNIKYYSADQISPPDGMKSVDWIRSGFKKK